MRGTEAGSETVARMGLPCPMRGEAHRDAGNSAPELSRIDGCHEGHGLVPSLAVCLSPWVGLRFDVVMHDPAPWYASATSWAAVKCGRDPCSWLGATDMTTEGQESVRA